MVDIDYLDKIDAILENNDLSSIEEYSSYCHDESLYGVTVYIKLDDSTEAELTIYYDLGYPGIVGKIIFGYVFFHEYINTSKLALKGVTIDIHNPDYKKTIYSIIKEYGATNKY